MFVVTSYLLDPNKSSIQGMYELCLVQNSGMNYSFELFLFNPKYKSSFNLSSPIVGNREHFLDNYVKYNWIIVSSCVVTYAYCDFVVWINFFLSPGMCSLSLGVVANTHPCGEDRVVKRKSDYTTRKTHTIKWVHFMSFVASSLSSLLPYIRIIAEG